MPIRNFKIEIPNEALEDLSLRLRKTKWANQIPETGWSMDK